MFLNHSDVAQIKRYNDNAWEVERVKLWYLLYHLVKESVDKLVNK